MAKKGSPKPAERFDQEKFDDEPLNPYESFEGRMERWLDQKEAVVELYERMRY